MPRFEAQILFETKHLPVLETYAESMGWVVDTWLETHVAMRRSLDVGTEQDILNDVEGAINFFVHSEDITPLSWRIVRVIFDSVTGYDEITECGDDNGA